MMVWFFKYAAKPCVVVVVQGGNLNKSSLKSMLEIRMGNISLRPPDVTMSSKNDCLVQKTVV